MRAYLVTSLDSDSKPSGSRYCGSEAEARQQRMLWMKSMSLPRKRILIEQVEIPTTKVDLLAFLNGELSRKGAENG